MATATPPRLTADQTIKRISAEYEHLSKQLKVIALHIEKNRDHVGIEGIQELARQCGVQPSAVVRFAQHFGYSGWSDLQRIFRDGMTRRIAPGRNYQARIRSVIDAAQGQLASADIADEFIAGSIAGMQELLMKLRFMQAIARGEHVEPEE